jgi:hypothetical protein
MNPAQHLLRPFLGLVLGLAAAQLPACERNGTGDLRISRTCADYCAAAVGCNDDLDEDDCASRCEDAMDDCMADDQEDALDDLDACAEDSCDDFAGCTIGAGLECAFGL